MGREIGGLGEACEEIKQKKKPLYFILSTRNFHYASRIHSKDIWFKALLLTVKMATSDLIVSKNKVIIFFRDICIFRFQIIASSYKI